MQATCQLNLVDPKWASKFIQAWKYLIFGSQYSNLAKVNKDKVFCSHTWKKIVHNLEFPFGTSTEPHLGLVELQNIVIHQTSTRNLTMPAEYKILLWKDK